MRKELKARGVFRVDGTEFSVHNITMMMTSPVYAAIRVFGRDLNVDGVIILAGRR